jgi:uncharacterized CHY-type Zn-finger protein
MAFEPWSPGTPPMPLRRIDNVMSPSSPLSIGRSLAKKQPDFRELYKGLPAQERIKKIQEYQMKKNKSALTLLENQPPRKTLRSSIGSSSYASFHDAAEGILGCKHYQTNVSLSAPCCDSFFVCRFCHDERSDHTIDRKAVDKLRCLRCGHVQSLRGDDVVDSKCETCQEQFARYYCSVCKFYDDDPQKDVYHCADCGVCRVGRPEQFFHCKGCNACISVDLRNNHRCLSGSVTSNCPVCIGSLANSVQATSLLPCGHAMHTSCLESYRKTNYRCPSCLKSLGDVGAIFSAIDRIMATMQVPEKYKRLQATISCRDCEKRSVVPHHFMYHKCTHCGSYNTSVLEEKRV